MKNIFLTLAMAIPAFSQSSIKDALVKHWKVTGDFTIAVANAMPADKYNFRPVPAEMSFGQVIAHIANADLGACATASGMQRPTIPAKVTDAAKDQKVEVDKDTAVQFLTDTVNFCNQAVASMTPEKLDAVVGTTRKATGFEWLWSYFTHTAHHRGQAEVYLRLNGIKPPDYVF
jgi:uncharacterized damage-inducible protein DinB